MNQEVLDWQEPHGESLIPSLQQNLSNKQHNTFPPRPQPTLHQFRTWFSAANQAGRKIPKTESQNLFFQHHSISYIFVFIFQQKNVDCGKILPGTEYF